ncbi:hypothetical protein PLANTIT3_50289 [Plantibacter sp. T3]|nr:hypothetical protein PLANTIT3_50289 [Plantibacter sp. T3]
MVGGGVPAGAQRDRHRRDRVPPGDPAAQAARLTCPPRSLSLSKGHVTRVHFDKLSDRRR